jgi:NADH-quinone oxidoreductase subunit G
MRSLVKHIEEQGLDGVVGVEATFCFENCDRGPTVHIGEQTLHHCTLEMAREAIASELARGGLAPA